jgi:hypothetical protein
MKRKPANSDELKQMTSADGMMDLPAAPADSGQLQVVTQLPDTESAAANARYLWVVRSDDLPLALEECSWGKSLESGTIKHSNLTGGAPAHSGGEIWFCDERTIIVNADSGRYGADSPQELEDFVAALRDCGYRVASMGFDIENRTKPNSVLIGDPVWLEPTDVS